MGKLGEAITPSQIAEQMGQVVDKISMAWSGPVWNVPVKRDIRGHYFKFPESNQKVRVTNVDGNWVANDGSKL